MKENYEKEVFYTKEGDADITYMIIESDSEESRKYGIHARMTESGEKVTDEAKIENMFYTYEEAAATAKCCAENQVEPIHISYIW